MKRFQFHVQFVVPCLTLIASGVVQLCVERQQMEVHLFAIDHIDGIAHVFDEYFIRCTRRMNADERFGLLGTIAFLATVFPLLVFTLVAVDGIHALFRFTFQRLGQHLV